MKIYNLETEKLFQKRKIEYTNKPEKISNYFNLKKTTFLLLIICFNSNNLFGQREAKNWYFGRNAGIEFTSNSSQRLTDGNIEAAEGCASISDAQGNLLFYTDGFNVMNSNHELMNVNDELLGHWSTTQSSIIIPKPNSNSIYYIFTLDVPTTENAEYYPDPNPDPTHFNIFDDSSPSDDGLNNGLNYSIVDMTLNNGLGGITSSNNHLITYDPNNTEEIKFKCSEKLTAVYNNDNSAIWILTHFIDKFYLFKIDENGIDQTPIIQQTVPNVPYSGYDSNAIGYMKFSPDGSKIAMANNSMGADNSNGITDGSAFVFDFNNTTGIISNPVQLISSLYPYGVAFSPDSSKLYFHIQGDGFNDEMFQFDLNSNNEMHDLNAFGEPYAMQLGIDGKIYFLNTWYNGYINMIDNPNDSGLTINFNNILPLRDFFTQPINTRIGLPNFIQTYFNRSIKTENLCVGEETTFEAVYGIQEITQAIWDFGDPASGIENSSTDLNPTHIFSSEGVYNVTAIVTTNIGDTLTVEKKIEIFDLSISANQIDDLHSCEDSFNSGFSTNFNTSNIENDLIGSQAGLNIDYYDSNGNQLPSPLPNPMTNSISYQETILARVYHTSNIDCYNDIYFDLIVDTIPLLNEIGNIYACDDNNDGFTNFDTSVVESSVIDDSTGLTIEYYDGSGNTLPSPLPNSLINSQQNIETITVRAIDNTTSCYSETSFDLIARPIPTAYNLDPLIGCDDNNDGVSEFFDTSSVEVTVLNGQTGMSVTYFDEDGNELPSQLPDPYTNTIPFIQDITIRVTDIESECYSETILSLETSIQPNINQPNNLYACDQGNGYAEFNTSSIEQELIGNQTGLFIQYYDSDNNLLPSPLPTLFQNTEPFSQTISVRVEDVSNPICYSETALNLIVNELPQINLEDEYFICNLEPSISLNINSGFNSYNWFFEDGTLISDTNSAEIIEEGNYTLTVTQMENGITCENSFEFTLIRSILPEIQEVIFGELGNNYIEIIASDNGYFEYSIDGINYQDSNYFSNIQGGMYTVFVRDKDGCGQDSEEVTVIDYPKFFTPNNDGYNDFWQIKGIVNFPNSKTSIFDRYGKLLTTISSNEIGWNGLYNSKLMVSNDYWFRTDLGNGRTFSGHFSLKR
ncbi:T9SS type B sorting domain-containing protein [Winogradskyella sp. Asnod2-B02-A]|uniref:T9SS type B sorting domain-containing protein n=1 Tax=Winogradskyella sp. Asnod2-B02-A TaxID=3160583 RepID=UPI00386FE23B